MSPCIAAVLVSLWLAPSVVVAQPASRIEAFTIYVFTTPRGDFARKMVPVHFLCPDCRG